MRWTLDQFLSYCMVGVVVMNVLSFSLNGYCDYMVLKVQRGINVILK